MGCLASLIGCETENDFLVEQSGLGRCQIIGDKDARLGDLGKVGWVFVAEQIVHDAGRHIAHIGSAFAHSVVFKLVQYGHVPSTDLGERELGIDFLGFDCFYDLVNEHGIIQDRQLCIEDGSVAGAHGCFDALFY